MPGLPVIPRTCNRCLHWIPAYVGPQIYGFCCWKENTHRTFLPRMNRYTHFCISADGKVLETRNDASCAQFEPHPKV